MCAQSSRLADVQRQAIDALGRGATVETPARVEWDVAGNCRNPVAFERVGRGDRPRGILYDSYAAGAPRLVESKYAGKGFLVMAITARCRKCEACLRVRAREWAAKARAEIAMAPRTWFGTLTLTPGWHAYFQSKARVYLGRQGVDYDILQPSDQHAELHRQIGPEITLMLKRLRGRRKDAFRYMLVVEAHKSGLPHYHMFIHERSPADPLRHAVLTAAWEKGFTKWKLVDDEDGRAAWYACKYLSKSAACRVRASQHYGEIMGPHDFTSTSSDIVRPLKTKSQRGTLTHDADNRIDPQVDTPSASAASVIGARASEASMASAPASEASTTPGGMVSGGREPANRPVPVYVKNPEKLVSSPASAIVTDLEEEIPF